MLWRFKYWKCCDSLCLVVLFQTLMREPNLLTQKALAAFLSVDRITIWSWHLRGVGPPRKLIGKRGYYPMEALRQWLSTDFGPDGKWKTTGPPRINGRIPATDAR